MVRALAVPPVWPRLDSRNSLYMWFELVVGSLFSARGFSLCINIPYSLSVVTLSVATIVKRADLFIIFVYIVVLREMRHTAGPGIVDLAEEREVGVERHTLGLPSKFNVVLNPT